MAVERGKGLSLEHGGKIHYFCCTGCRTRVEQDPQRFTDDWPAAAHAGHHR